MKDFRTILLIAIVSLLVIFATSNYALSQTATTTPYTFELGDYQFTANIPADWKIEKQKDGDYLFENKNDPDNIAIFLANFQFPFPTMAVRDEFLKENMTAMSKKAKGLADQGVDNIKGSSVPWVQYTEDESIPMYTKITWPFNSKRVIIITIKYTPKAPLGQAEELLNNIISAFAQQ